MSALSITLAMLVISFTLSAAALTSAAHWLKYRHRQFRWSFLVVLIWSVLNLLFASISGSTELTLFVLLVFCFLEGATIWAVMGTTPARAAAGWGIAFVARLLVLAFALFGIRGRLVQAYRPPTEAMAPTLLSKPADLFMVTKFLRPDRWDLITYHQGSEIYVKRLIGLPGEEIRIDLEGHIWINGKDIGSPPDIPGKVYPWLERAEDHIKPGGMNPGASLQLGPEEYFVIGDNSERSVDSRIDGPVKTADIDGVVTWIYWPISRMRIVR